MDSEISHDGIVQSAGKDSVIVMLSAGVSCYGCQAEKACNISGNERKMIRVDGSYSVEPGDKVIVSMKKSQGFTALILGYVLPLVIVLASLVTLISFSVNELYSGLISLGLLVPYYGFMFLLRKSISNRFTFTLNRKT